MEHPNEEADMPTPLNSAYGGPMMSLDIVPAASFKKMVKYKECLKNHAAAIGCNATDGCGEFMPSGEEGSLEALTCSACTCHRNFHRKEIEGQEKFSSYSNNHVMNPRFGGKIFVGPPQPNYNAGAIVSYNIGSVVANSESDEDGTGLGGFRPPMNMNMMMKKRFRTKFSQEQKEKMLNFAEKVGWKIQRQEESVVQQFCQEVGVKRKVLKVWIHNNKHTLAKKIANSSDDGNGNQEEESNHGCQV